ncbi:MAG TPA: exodeoxyribonuclease V subunit gamma, partial [Pseudoxanthomonas sp.]|nr:exodeoxyribonuclease V subunit gamma [Pseudoxanthomonas sp.]
MARQALQRAVFEARLRGEDPAATHAWLRARGGLPSGPLGRRTLETLRAEIEPYAEAFAAWRGDAVAEAPRVEAELEALTLHGRIADAYPHGIARVRFDPPNGTSSIRDGLDWLLASAAGLPAPLVQFHAGSGGGMEPHARPPLDSGLARALLERLLALRATGLRTPLAFAPYSGWELFNAPTLERGLQLAAGRWRGSERGWGEGQGEALRLTLRGRDPFTDEATTIAFVEQALTVYSAVVNGTLYAGGDRDALREVAADLDLDLEPAE